MVRKWLLAFVGFGPLLFALGACSGSSAADDSPETASEGALVLDACDEGAIDPGWIRTEHKRYADLGLTVRVGTMGSGRAGDVLYLHGFADRFDNHKPLFDRFVAEGLRVISFDLPSHGETCGASLDLFDFTELAELAMRVERDYAGSGPLTVAGWSTGGLIAVRIAQGITRNTFSRPIAKMALFAPGVDVKPVIAVSDATLTRNPHPPHVAPPKPASPALRPIFAGELVFNSQRSRANDMPAMLPVLLFTGGEAEDAYVHTKGEIAWVSDQRAHGADITALRCNGGYHELDNEPEPMGDDVRSSAARFLVGGDSVEGTSSCERI